MKRIIIISLILGLSFQVFFNRNKCSITGINFSNGSNNNNNQNNGGGNNGGGNNGGGNNGGGNNGGNYGGGHNGFVNSGCNIFGHDPIFNHVHSSVFDSGNHIHGNNTIDNWIFKNHDNDFNGANSGKVFFTRNV